MKCKITTIFILLFTCNIALSDEDKLIMDGTAVIGNSEMPNVLYVVPWKKTPQPNLNPELNESLIGEQLKPIDRNVFLRRIKHHNRNN